MADKNEWIPMWKLKVWWGKKDDEILDLVLNHGLKAYDDDRKPFTDTVMIWVNEKRYHPWMERMGTTSVRKAISKDKVQMIRDIAYFKFDDIRNFEIEHDMIPQRSPDRDSFPAEEGHEEIKTKSALSQEESRGDNFFKLDGSVWHIGFEGKAASIPSSEAIRYIALLLEKPGQPLSCLELQQVVKGILVETNFSTDKGAMDEGLNNIIWTKSGERVNDPMAETEYKKHYQELKDQLYQGDDLNETEREKIENEMEVIEKTLREKNFNSPRKKAQSAVKQQINNAFKAIKKAEMKNLAIHLQKNIHTGGQYDYLYNDEKTIWNVSW